MEQPRTLEEIVAFCRDIQTKSASFRKENLQYRRVLINFCHHCTDKACPDSCEVKKAYRATF